MIARKPGRVPITQAEIASITGWGEKKVETMCGLKTWADVTVSDADKFRAACGIDRANQRRHKAYLRRTLDLGQTVTGLAAARKRPGIAQKRLIRLMTGVPQ